MTFFPPKWENKTTFQEMTSDLFEVYTDGACSNNGRGSAVAGIGVHWPHDTTRDIAQPVTGLKHTNNVAELQAIEAALDGIRAHEAKDGSLAHFVIFSDSTYAINCLTTWWALWKARGTFPPHMQNKDLIVCIQEKLAAFGPRVSLRHVFGHADSEGNIRADALARKGAKAKAEPEPKPKASGSSSSRKRARSTS